MPERGKRTYQTKSSYEALSKKNGVDIDATLDPDLKSFIHLGDAAYTDETIDGKSRNEIIQQIRVNVLSKMRQENLASSHSADVQSDRHAAYTTGLTEDAQRLKIQQAAADYKRNMAEYNEARYKMTGEGRFGRLSRYYAARKAEKALARVYDAGRVYDEGISQIIQKAQDWDKIEADYQKNVFRKHYKNYDALAKTWYEITRDFSGSSDSGVPAAGSAIPSSAVPAATGNASGQAVFRRTSSPQTAISAAVSPAQTSSAESAPVMPQVTAQAVSLRPAPAVSQRASVPRIMPGPGTTRSLPGQTGSRRPDIAPVRRLRAPVPPAIEYTDKKTAETLAGILAQKDETWKKLTLPHYRDAIAEYDFIREGKDPFKEKKSPTAMSHYVTVTGFNPDSGMIQYYDSSGYAGSPKTKTVDEFLSNMQYVQIHFLSDRMKPGSEEFNREFPDYNVDRAKGYGYTEIPGGDNPVAASAFNESLSHTRGVTYVKAMDDGVTFAVYVPAQDLIVDTESIGASGERIVKPNEPQETGAPSQIDRFPVQTEFLSGMNEAYSQQEETNFCFVVTGTAMLNQFISRRVGSEKIERFSVQREMQEYIPKVRKNREAGYENQINNILSYAGPGKNQVGSIFEMGDFLMERLAEHGINDALLFKEEIPIGDTPQGQDSARTLFIQRIADVLNSNSVAGVMTTTKPNEGIEDAFDSIQDSALRYYLGYLRIHEYTISSSIPFEEGVSLYDKLAEVFDAEEQAAALREAAPPVSEPLPESLPLSDRVPLSEEPPVTGAASSSVSLSRSVPLSAPQPVSLPAEEILLRPASSEGSVPGSVQAGSAANEENSEALSWAKTAYALSKRLPLYQMTVYKDSNEAKNERLTGRSLRNHLEEYLNKSGTRLSRMGKDNPKDEIIRAIQEFDVLDQGEARAAFDAEIIITAPAPAPSLMEVSLPASAKAPAPVPVQVSVQAPAPAPAPASATDDDTIAERDRLLREMRTFEQTLPSFDEIVKDMPGEGASDLLYLQERNKLAYYLELIKFRPDLAVGPVLKLELNRYIHMADIQAGKEAGLGEGAEPDAGSVAEPIDENEAKRVIPDFAAKKIEEYIGTYDMDSVLKLKQQALNPDFKIDAAGFPVKDDNNKVTGQDSSNIADPARHRKIHTRILMLSQQDRDTGIQTRYKLGQDFRGVMAGHQFQVEGSEETAAVALTADQLEEKRAGEMELESDARDAGGRLLFSERNAQILSSRLKSNGQIVHGFYLNGQFVTDQELLPGEAPSGKEDTGWFRGRDWDKQERAEKLRVAIRNSLFFQHINSRTIQYYTSYRVDEEYVNAIRKAAIGRKDAAAKGKKPQTPEEAVEILLGPDPDFDQIRKELIGPAIAVYIESKTDPGFQPRRGQNAFNADNPVSDPVVSHAVNYYPEEMVFCCLMLLSDSSNPGLWTIARNIVEHNVMGVAERTRIKLEYLPKSGEMMRMGLLEELANHQSIRSGIDLENLTNVFESSRERVYTEELQNRRGFRNALKRGVLSGELIKKIINAGATGVSAIEQGSDVGLKEGEHGWGSPEERLERKFWFSYAEGVSHATNGLSAFSLVFTGMAAANGGAVGAGVSRDLFFDAGNLFQGFGYIVTMVRGIRDAVRYYRKQRKLKNPKTEEEKREKEATLEDLDFSGFKSILRALDCFFAACGCIRDILSVHITKDQGPLSAAQNSDFADLVSPVGIITKAISLLRRIVKVIDDSREIHAARLRKGRLETADKNIVTAIEAVESLSEEQFEDLIARAAERQRSAEGSSSESEKSSNEEFQKMVLELQVGKAAKENTQAQDLLELIGYNSTRQITDSSFNIATNILGAIDDVAALTGGPLLRVFTILAPKVSEFIGWITHVGMDRHELTVNIEKMLGDKEYADFRYPYFDEVLKRETGIVSKRYLVDLARIFASIDTHAMLNNPDANQGELELAKRVVGTMYGNVNDISVKTIGLSDMLRYAGFDEKSDWRSLLRNSLMA
ncbi:MAG: hypothetical protein K5770_02580 [Lachnospiraceae bacterium]|nr:hypothetical protein [Lachnospiraceae bacterium]